jgi:type III restriction enzyme
MELKDYQQTVLDTLDAYLDELLTQQAKAEKVRKANEAVTDPDLILPVPDSTARAWERMKEQNRLPPFRAGIAYSARKDGVGEDVPDICLKLPTGGGKTLLAASAVSRIMGRYLRRNYGFVLWIVPNEAIYAQTKKHLSNREHAYRQILDRAAAGRVKFLEKTDPLNKLDVESHLCVMLLMLQAANRETKETLRLFRDRGSVHGFFPPADDVLTHFKLLGQVKNLSCYGNRDNMGAVTHDSLGNVLRVLRPVVVMDEGHRSYTASAMATLYDFNPSFVLELSATPQDRAKDTPPKYANWLADVRGVELQREEMIKLPINVKVKAGDDWRDCLSESLEHLKVLQAHAEKLRANTARYIRPILLVQVERTGKDQRESQYIHSEAVREFLLSLGMDQSEIAIKTAEKNELNQPENIDLLSETCPVRVIITKQALQEGWDCPFAYVLCTLAANRNLKAMTQLVGRILRQPGALYTGDPLLNECYVFCHHAKTKDVIDAIKEGLEQDGMADVAGQIRETDPNAKKEAGKRKLPRREKFKTLDIYLPLVNWVDDGEARPLDYERDVLSRLDWLELNLKSLAEQLATEVEAERSQMVRLSLVPEPGREFLEQSKVQNIQESALFDPVYATRLIVDIVPNAWVARAMIGDLLKALDQRGFDDVKLGAASSYILEELRKWLIQQRDALAEKQFIGDVNEGRIQFRLRADRALWQMPKEIETDRLANAPQLPRNSGGPVERSMFTPVYRDDFNSDEADFACYLDELQALRWWHRNVAKAGSYWIQGWKKHKVYPDFIFAHERQGKTDLIRVWETKGDQLEGNLDTQYKRKVLEIASKHYRAEDGVKAGRLELVGRAGETVECDLVLMSEWKTEVSKRLRPNADSN